MLILNSIYVLIFYRLLFVNGHERKCSLTFVIDQTKSMLNDIIQVKSKTHEVFDAVLRKNSSMIDDFILVTFDDPGTHVLAITRDQDVFRQALDGITLIGNNDCPEFSMSGIELALEKSKPNSFLYVFTDASAKDSYKFPQVKKLSLKKSIQVSFLLTEPCYSETENNFLIYNELSHATSGQVFHIKKDDINKIINYIIQSIGQEKVTLEQKLYGDGNNKKITITADSKISDIMVSVSGLNPSYDITDPDGNVVATEEIATTEQTSIRKFRPKPGVYTVNLHSSGPTSVVVTGLTDISFQPGFSLIKPESLNDTSALPIAGTKSHLGIALSNPTRDVLLKTVQLKDMDDKVIKELPVTLVDEDKQFYVTEPFESPNELFKIVINGVMNTGENITRISPTNIVPQIPEPGTYTSPVVTIVNGEKIQVDYNQPVVIKCKIHGFPQPDVVCGDSTGAVWPSTVTPVDIPYDFISVLTLDKVTKNMTVTCKASNAAGTGAQSIEVEVKNYFFVLEYPKDVTIEYRKSANFKLTINAQPPAKITWYKNHKQITENDYFHISPDKSVLKIENMQPKLKDKYSVTAVNAFEKKTFHFAVSISGAERPVIDKKTNTVFAIAGSNVNLQCRVLQGKPKPAISWSVTGYGEPVEKHLKETTEILSFNNLAFADSGYYKCIARNDIGQDSHEIELIVKYPPTIDEEHENIKVIKTNVVKIICTVHGFPFPNIRWFKNKSEIVSGNKYLIDPAYVLRFRATIGDDGVYSCEASNDIGTAQRNVRLQVYVPVTIEKPKENVLNIQVGSRLELPCVATGYPKPEVKWTFYRFEPTVTPRKLRPASIDSVVIPEVKLEDGGYYVCGAGNLGNVVSLTYEVHVLVPPVIQNKLPNKNLTAVVGDTVLTIPCRAIGVPKPTISWTVDGLNIAEGAEYSVQEDGTLLIKNVTKRSSGTYVCKAENPLSFDIEEYNVDVQPYPMPKHVTTKEVFVEGTTAVIKCDLPHNKTDSVRWFKNGKLVKFGDTLTIPQISLSDAGLYSCRVSNFQYSHSSDKKIVIGLKPKFLTDEETQIEFSNDATVYLECSASGDPKYKWSHNGASVAETSSMLVLTMTASDIGEYTCVATNEFGSVHRTFSIDVEDCMLNVKNDFTTQNPLILDARKNWLEFERVDDFIKLQKHRVVLLACPGSYITYEGHKMDEEMFAECSKKTIFKIKGKSMDLKKIKCNYEINPLAKGMHKQCHGRNTELFTVGFSLRYKFLGVYNVCFDKDRKLTLYTTHNIQRSLANSIPTSPIRYTGSKYLPLDFNDIFECSDRCCFAKRQLVNPRDVSVGFQQVSTYSDLNVVPKWSSCGTKNWDELERRVRSLAKTFDSNLIVWTGAIYDPINRPHIIYRTTDADRPVPLYVWKVIESKRHQQGLAVIQVNIPNLKQTEAPSHVFCKDICNEVEWMKNPQWLDVSKGFTYCCSVKDFKAAFDYNDLFRDSKHILNKMPLVSVNSLT